MTLQGLAGRTLVEEEEVARVVDRLAEEISADHGDGLVLLGILKGSVCLLADLARRLAVPCAVDFLSLTAYSSGAPRVRLGKDLEIDVAGRDVVVVVDLIDSGLTVNYVRRLLGERGARSTRVCALLDRAGRRLIPTEVAYRGLEIGDEYVVGYGLDIGERYRNLPRLVVIDRESAPSRPFVDDVGYRE